MATFSHLSHPFLLDSLFVLNASSNINMLPLTLPQQRHDHFLTSTDFDAYSAVQHDPQYTSYVVPNQEPANFLQDSVSGTKVTSSHDSEVVTKRNSDNDGGHDSQKVSFVEKRRKRRRSSPLTPVKPKIATQGKSKRQKKITEGDMHGEKKQTKADQKEVSEEVPTGYIHVRARRGEATDSHSLAERVRREKISERMLMLQRLVPGCDKVTGKALMLDEIINYVQSLQNQVEFLSMRLTSLNPTLYDFTMDLDTCMVGQEKFDNIATCRPNLIRANLTRPNLIRPNQHPTATANPTTATITTMSGTFTFTPDGNDHCLSTPFSNSTPVLVQGQGADSIGEESASRRLYWDMDDQRQKYLSRCHQQQRMQFPTMELTQDMENCFPTYN